MIELLLYWALPSSIIFGIFYWMVYQDGLRMREVETYAFNLMIIMSVIWPIGAIAITAISIEVLLKKLRILR